MTELNALSLTAAAEQLRWGNLSAEALVNACLDRISKRDDAIHAWVRVYADDALATAQQCDKEANKALWRGPLHGLPIGIKDIFDVEQMETRAGTSAYQARTAERDAVCVERLKAAGAIILGKTETTAFAMGDPAPTRNPWHPDHTPGGSSSGSAAAVADRMCPAALGSQTVGSVIRPASYNGIVGFKPTYGCISTKGVIPLSWQLDHIGTLTRSVADAWLLWQVMRDDGPAVTPGDDDYTMPLPAPQMPQRIWRVRDFFESEAHPEILRALDDACQVLAAEGVEIIERSLPASCERLIEAHFAIMASEAAAYHRKNYQSASEHYPPRIGELVQKGLELKATDYVSALHHRQALIHDMQQALGDVDAAVMPAATGPAPADLSHTGDRLFNTLSSYCGLPVVSIPVAFSEKWLPLGIQLLGGQRQDDTLLALAAWCEKLLPFAHSPQ